MPRIAKTYKLVRDGQDIGVFTVRKICEMLNKPFQTIYAAAERGFFVLNSTCYEFFESEDIPTDKVEVTEPARPTVPNENFWILKKIPNAQKPKANGYLS